jgi:hypothetical protein
VCRDAPLDLRARREEMLEPWAVRTMMTMMTMNAIAAMTAKFGMMRSPMARRRERGA